MCNKELRLKLNWKPFNKLLIYLAAWKRFLWITRQIISVLLERLLIKSPDVQMATHTTNSNEVSFLKLIFLHRSELFEAVWQAVRPDVRAFEFMDLVPTYYTCIAAKTFETKSVQA